MPPYNHVTNILFVQSLSIFLKKESLLTVLFNDKLIKKRKSPQKRALGCGILRMVKAVEVRFLVVFITYCTHRR